MAKLFELTDSNGQIVIFLLSKLNLLRPERHFARLIALFVLPICTHATRLHVKE